MSEFAPITISLVSIFLSIVAFVFNILAWRQDNRIEKSIIEEARRK